EIIGLALAILVFARLDGAWANLLNRVGSRPPAFFRLTVFEWPGNDAQAHHVFVVDRNRPGQLRAMFLALWCSAALADIRDQENVRHDAFRMAHETIAIGEILDHPVTDAERSVLEAYLWHPLHQRSLKLVAANHLMEHQQMPRIDDILVMLQPVAISHKA